MILAEERDLEIMPIVPDIICAQRHREDLLGSHEHHLGLILLPMALSLPERRLFRPQKAEVS